ncbi:Bug family tripartite tricarboxylate transporter substrate binding protein [Bradyrhizobium glycinis]|uniref:Bug family tripartite tricarboxylate transporter substrate binding protein n=1 Tax=Bradyrhizobium glycinis TaxID=2751812 RepID=UPI0018D8A71C|nr:tripartite tricarboxylate transporter substrate binding protein [Bradyrhizobium glycinis]MBH5371937.1 tripartite tricarboxylate transporter substrate binding protein [Bradyrhizobium glycinis]
MAIGKIISRDRAARRGWPRSAVLVSSALLAVAGLSAAPARAEYPEKIVKIVVPFAAGGGTDIVARTTAQEIQTDLGKPVIIENKPGAGTIVGTQTVATSEPDGYSLLLATFAHAVNPSLYNKLPFDPHKDFAAVSLIARSFNVVVVNPTSKINSISDLIAEAKARPGKLNFGTFGIGTSAHLAGELFNAMANVKMTAVPYKGAAPAISDLLGGQIDVMFTTVASAASLVAAGQLRALAVTSAERSAAFPQLPTVSEAGLPGYAAESWYGLYAPAKTPAPVIARLAQAIAKAIRSGAFKQLSTNEGLIMVGSAPEELDRYVRQEEERWRKLVKDANIEVQ